MLKQAVLIASIGVACSSFPSEDRGAKDVSVQSSGLTERVKGLRPDGKIGAGGGLGPGGVLPDVGELELWTGGALIPGDYSQEVLEVFSASQERDDLYEGSVSIVTIEDGPTGASLHGFIDLQVTGPNVTGSGLLIDADPGYDCAMEWLQAIEGRVFPDGTAELDISEIIAVAGKQCVYTDLGDPHLEQNAYSVILTPL